MQLDYSLSTFMNTSSDKALEDYYMVTIWSQELADALNKALDAKFGKTKWGVRVSHDWCKWRLILHEPQYKVFKKLVERRYCGITDCIDFDDPYKD